MEPPHYYYTNRTFFMRAFQWYLGGSLGPFLEAEQSISPSLTSCSCQLYFLPPTTQKLISSSADPAQRRNDIINWSMVWTLCSYRFSTGSGRLMVLCPDDMTPCPKVILSTWRRLHGGLFAPPPSTSRRRRGNRTSPGRSNRGKEDDENQCDASTTHCALNSLISININ